MRYWLLLLGGPLIWAAHFLAIYIAASVSHVAIGPTNNVARLAIIVLSMAAIAGALLLAIHAWCRLRAGSEDAFSRTIGLAGALLAIVAVIWQTLPILAPIDGTALLQSR